MKYYLIITPFFPEPDSFVGPYVLDQTKAIARNSDYEVIVMKPCSFRQKKPDYVYDSIKVYRPKDYTIPSNLLPNRISDRLSYRSVMRKLREINVNPLDIAVCHAHVASLGSTAMLMKRDYPHIKTVVQHHGFDVMSETDGRFASFEWHKQLCRRLNIEICNEADLNVGVSKLTLDYVNNIPGANLKDTYVLYNGVDTSLFYPLERKNHNQYFTIGCIGNFWELKDQITLIKALELLVKNGIDNIRVLFIGTGYTRQMCEEYIESHGLSMYFKFSPTMHHFELPDFYRSLDLFVLPSYWEAFGCVYTEAYACGVPFIAVKGQGISEIIPERIQDQWLIEKEDYKGLASSIQRVIKGIDCHQDLSISIDIDDLIKLFLQYLKG